MLEACQNNTLMSTPCELNSDCVAPLVCTDGVCMEDCVSQRDCIRGEHCAVANHVGSCVPDQPLDHATSPCAPGRVCASSEQTCRDFTCWSPCTTQADCVLDSYCRNGLCVNPQSPGYGYGDRVVCDASRPCPTGQICATDHGSHAACRRPCTTDAGCTDIAAASLCAAIDDPAYPGMMACVIGCDPVRQLGCIETDRCDVNVAAGPTGMHTIVDCRGTDGMTVQGASCGTTTPALASCGAGLGCAPNSLVETTGYQCDRYCVVDGDCHSASLQCTGPSLPGIENRGVVNGVLASCRGI